MNKSQNKLVQKAIAFENEVFKNDALEDIEKINSMSSEEKLVEILKRMRASEELLTIQLELFTDICFCRWKDIDGYVEAVKQAPIIKFIDQTVTMALIKHINDKD